MVYLIKNPHYEQLWLVATFVLVFVNTLVSSICWARYMHHADKRQPLRAALWDAGIIGCSAFNVVSYVSDHWMLVPVLFGAFVGTYIGVKHK